MHASGKISNSPRTSPSSNPAEAELEVPVPENPQWTEIILNHELPNQSQDASRSPQEAAQAAILAHKSPTLSASEEPLSEFDCESEDAPSSRIATLDPRIQKEILSKSLPQQLPEDAYEHPVELLLPTELSSEECKVRIAKCEVIEGSLFARQQLVLTLLTKPLGWMVQRKSSDCVWLSTALSAKFVGQCVPTMPQKVLGLSQAKYLYEKFLNILVRNQIFSRSTYLVEFLSQSDPQAFALVQATSRAAPKVTRLSQICSPTGTVTCLPFSPSEASGALCRYLTDSESALQSLHEKSQAVISSLQQVNGKLTGFAEELKILAAMQTMTESANHRLIYIQIGRVLECWGRYQTEMSDEINEKLSSFFSYRQSEFSALKRIFLDLEALSKVYLKDEKTLQTKKEKLWVQWGLQEGAIGPLASDKVSAFAIMLPVETHELEGQKQFLDYLHFQVRSEVSRLLVQSRYSEKKHFDKLAIRCDEKSQALSALWREATLNLSRFFSSQ